MSNLVNPSVGIVPVEQFIKKMLSQNWFKGQYIFANKLFRKRPDNLKKWCVRWVGKLKLVFKGLLSSVQKMLKNLAFWNAE